LFRGAHTDENSIQQLAAADIYFLPPSAADGRQDKLFSVCVEQRRGKDILFASKQTCREHNSQSKAYFLWEPTRPGEERGSALEVSSLCFPFFVRALLCL
jgi:hypothetical protein